MFPFLFSIATRVIETKRDTFSAALEKSDYNLVLVTALNIFDSKKVTKYFNAAAHKFESGLGFISLDVTNDNTNKQAFQISEYPLVFLYYKSNKVMQYTENITIEDLYNFGLQVIKQPEIHYPKNVFEILEFQQMAPANLIITDLDAVGRAEEIAQAAHCLIHVAVCTDPHLTAQLDLDDMVFSKPLEEYKTTFDPSIKITELIRMAQPTWNYVANQNLIGKQCVCALFDKSIPWHYYRINEVFNMTKAELGIPVFRYFVIDYFDAPKFVRQFGVFKFSFPIFFVTGTSASVWQVCENPLQPSEDIYWWIRLVITGKGKPQAVNRVPQLYAHDFQRLALDAKTDCVLLVADPGMEYYKECRKNAEIIAEIFEGCENIVVYEFNPRTEHVMGLQIPSSKTPQFSVWPAVEPYNGKTFQANYPLAEIMKILFKIFRAPIKDDQAKAAVALARKLVPGL